MKGKKMRARIGYLILLVVVIGLYLWSNAQSSLFLAALLLVLAPVAIVENQLAARGMRVAVRLEERHGQGEEGTVTVIVQAQNRSFFPAFWVQADAALKNRLTGSSYALPCEFSVRPRGQAECRFRLESLYCGRIEGEAAQAWVSDFLGLSRVRISAGGVGGCYSYPQVQELDMAALDYRRQEEIMPAERYTHTKGNDITEILNIRDYQKGDNIKTIHWKLSKKLGHKVVRELDMPANQDVILLMALSPARAQEGEWRHRVAQTALNLSQLLLQEQIFYDAVLLRDGGNAPGLYTIQEQKARDWYEQLLLDGDIEMGQEHAEQYIAYHQVLAKYASVILVTDPELAGWYEEYAQVIQITAL